MGVIYKQKNENTNKRTKTQTKKHEKRKINDTTRFGIFFILFQRLLRDKNVGHGPSSYNSKQYNRVNQTCSHSLAGPCTYNFIDISIGQGTPYARRSSDMDRFKLKLSAFTSSRLIKQPRLITSLLNIKFNNYKHQSRIFKLLNILSLWNFHSGLLAIISHII